MYPTGDNLSVGFEAICDISANLSGLSSVLETKYATDGA